MLSVECPGCGAEVTSRWLLLEGGLRCPGSCGEKGDRRGAAEALASAIARRYPHACYVFTDRSSGEVKYVGVSTRLGVRLGQHGRGRLSNRDALVGKALADRCESAGEDVRVALQGCELAWWHLLQPSENRARPAHVSSGMFRMRDGSEYDVRFLGARTRTLGTEALDLETLLPPALGAAEGPAAAADALGPAGIIAVPKGTSSESLQGAMSRHGQPCRELRKWKCKKAGRRPYAYCKCAVPCVLRAAVARLDPPRAAEGEAETEAEAEAAGEDDEDGDDSVPDEDDDEETVKLLHDAWLMGGSSVMRAKVLERRARRFYGEQQTGAESGEGGKEAAPFYQGLDRPWFMAPLQR